MKTGIKFLSIVLVFSGLGFGARFFVGDFILSKAEASQMEILRKQKQQAQAASAEAVRAKQALKLVLSEFKIDKTTPAVFRNVDHIQTNVRNQAIIQSITTLNHPNNTTKAGNVDVMINAIEAWGNPGAAGGLTLGNWGENRVLGTNIQKTLIDTFVPHSRVNMKKYFRFPANASIATMFASLIRALRRIQIDYAAGQPIAVAAGEGTPGDLSAAVRGAIIAAAQRGTVAAGAAGYQIIN